MVVKCLNCGQYVSDTASVCPKCGASMTVSTTKKIANDVTDTNTNNHSESPKTFNSDIEVFPELVPHLRQHLITHNEVGNSSEVITYINIWDFDYDADDFDDADIEADAQLRIYNHRGSWEDGEPVRLEGENSGFCLRLSFLAYSDDENEQKRIKIEDERIQRFRKLDSFSSFAPYRSWDGGYEYREFALDLGKDLEKASLLISEILQKVYLVPSSEELEIKIEVHNDSDNQEMNADNNVENNQVANNLIANSVDDQDNSYEVEDDSAGIFVKILCFLLPIVGFVLYFVKRNSLPNAAKSYLIWAAAGFGLSLLVNLAL